jgi:alpha-beta hydrolase superfamily lysophospholipase
MQHAEGHFNGAADRAIYHQTWLPDVDPRAIILVAHGAGEHSGFFTDRGIAVAAMDHHGHGRSEGRYGYADSFEDYLLDLNQWRELLGSRFAGLPMFLLGHSMGGLVTGNYLPDHQAGLVGGIFSGLLLIPAQEPGTIQRFLIKLLAVVLPRLGVLKLDPDQICRDPKIVRRYVQDPLVFHGSMSTRMLRELFAGMNRLQDRATEITLPVLVLHGSKDLLTNPVGSRLLHEKASAADKALTIYPGLYHEIFNEPEGESVLAEVLAWCEQRLPQF